VTTARKPKTVREPKVVSSNGVRRSTLVSADDDVLEVNLDHLTVEEIEDIEEVIDAPIDSLQDPTKRKGKTLRAIVYVLCRRDDPDFTLEQAGKKRIKFDQSMVPPTGGGA
jgi:hypothetical protein